MKTAQVIWTTEAIVDLEIIHDFIAQKSPSSATKTIEKILERAKQIESFPESGAQQILPARNTTKEYRYLIEDKYKIIYSYLREAKIIYIETVFDTRHDPTEVRR